MLPFYGTRIFVDGRRVRKHVRHRRPGRTNYRNAGLNGANKVPSSLFRKFRSRPVHSSELVEQRRVVNVVPKVPNTISRATSVRIDLRNAGRNVRLNVSSRRQTGEYITAPVEYPAHTRPQLSRPILRIEFISSHASRRLRIRQSIQSLHDQPTNCVHADRHTYSARFQGIFFARSMHAFSNCA